MAHHANLGRRRAKGVSGCYVVGRSAGGFVIGVSFFATYASTNSYVGNAGKGYEYGLAWLIMAAVMVLFTWLSWTAVAPRMRRFAAHWDAMTLHLRGRLCFRGAHRNAAWRTASGHNARRKELIAWPYGKPTVATWTPSTDICSKIEPDGQGACAC